MQTFGPNPPSRKEEDFPKTTTVPEGWIFEALTSAPVPNTGNTAAEPDTRPAPVVEDETLFTRRLDPFPQPNTIPNGWDISDM
jgi:hypothetical protein